MPGRPSKESEAGARRPLPPFTEKHERLRAEIRRFVAEELRPHAGEWEDARWFPNDVFTHMAELGLLGLEYPRELGGRGRDHLDDAVLTEELSRCGSGGVAAGIGAHIGIATPPIWSFGTEGQKQRFLAPAIRGEKIAALGITEPGAGSDVAGLRTSARRVDGGYVVNGSKTFITNGVRADFVVTAVKTTEEGGHQGLSFLIVERESEGFEVSKKLEKLGWHASDTGDLTFSDVFVPEDNLLGEQNRGFYRLPLWERVRGRFANETLTARLFAVRREPTRHPDAARNRRPRAAASRRRSGRASARARGRGQRARVRLDPVQDRDKRTDRLPVRAGDGG